VTDAGLQERVIGGCTYQVQKLTGRRQWRVFRQLVESGDLNDAALEMLFKHALVDGKPLVCSVHLDVELQDHPTELDQLVGFACEVNFADFFAARRAPLAPAPAVAVDGSPASTT
jgi:hypothetical protein